MDALFDATPTPHLCLISEFTSFYYVCKSTSMVEDRKYQDTEYLLYSSKLGVVFKQDNGSFLVDRTYNYDVFDDAQKILRGNKIIDEKQIKMCSY